MKIHGQVLALCAFTSTSLAAQQPRAATDAGRKQFESFCSRCHGADGAGGERGPDIVHAPTARALTEKDLRALLRTGIPGAGMPPVTLVEPQLGSLVTYVRTLLAPAAEHPVAGDVAAGQTYFFGTGQCSECHMVRGRGRLSGPDLTDLGRQRTRTEIEAKLRNPSATSTPGYRMVSVRLRDGKVIRGFNRNQSNYDVQLVDADGVARSLSRNEYTEIIPDSGSTMPPVKASDIELRNLMAYLTRLSAASGAVDSGTPPPASAFDAIVNPKRGEWPTYHGRLDGNRHSPLDQITRSNVDKLALRWMFLIPNSGRLEVTPVVMDGVMYVTKANEAFAIDARTGRQIWHFARPRTQGLVGDAGSGINRGVAILGDRLFLVTDHAHLLALHRATGALLWDIVMADYRQHYGSTSAPLVVNDLVVAGVSGGDEGARGFLAAYKATTGERVWRFWAVPAPGEPLAKTSWRGRALEHGCGSTWLSGTYDPQADLLYWPVGNPCPDYNGDERLGDNLYSSSVLALSPRDGALKWHFQFTPHDVHDWDAQQTPMLIDTRFAGRDRKLLVQASRNGFFYVLDRLTGEFLLAQPFVKKLTWASGIGADGRPVLLPGAEPTVAGVRACPAVEGANNWMSTAWNPATGLFYVMALEKCNIYTKSSAWWEPGKSFYGGATRDVPGEPGEKYLRAIDVQTGKVVWEQRQIGDGETWGGVLSTVTGLLFYGDDAGAFAAADAKNGEPLWHFHTNQTWKASPMTYMVAGKQYVSVAAGMNVLAFSLPD